ncbi:hypothetical protein AB0I54_47780 [Streptomyces sp. NPDC050625]|uniref:hypothetical protein n=1 Tax=Streptomyces sp. NPDC050625 TaxID=3154629 RepID=UPI00343C2535
MTVAVVLLATALVIVVALLVAAGAGKLARMDGATYPAALALTVITRIRLPSASTPLLRRRVGAGLPPPLEPTAPHGANRNRDRGILRCPLSTPSPYVARDAISEDVRYVHIDDTWGKPA